MSPPHGTSGGIFAPWLLGSSQRAYSSPYTGITILLIQHYHCSRYSNNIFLDHKQMIIFHKYSTSQGHIEKISCQYSTSNSLRSIGLDTVLMRLCQIFSLVTPWKLYHKHVYHLHFNSNNCQAYYHNNYHGYLNWTYYLWNFCKNHFKFVVYLIIHWAINLSPFSTRKWKWKLIFCSACHCHWPWSVNWNLFLPHKKVINLNRKKLKRKGKLHQEWEGYSW